jgi:hypothetical protein
MFLRNVGSLSKDYKASYPGRWTLYSPFIFSRFIFPKSSLLWNGVINSLTVFHPQFCTDFSPPLVLYVPPTSNLLHWQQKIMFRHKCTKERNIHLTDANAKFCIYLSQNAFFMIHPSQICRNRITKYSTERHHVVVAFRLSYSGDTGFQSRVVNRQALGFSRFSSFPPYKYWGFTSKYSKITPFHIFFQFIIINPFDAKLIV